MGFHGKDIFVRNNNQLFDLLLVPNFRFKMIGKEIKFNTLVKMKKVSTVTGLEPAISSFD